MDKQADLNWLGYYGFYWIPAIVARISDVAAFGLVFIVTSCQYRQAIYFYLIFPLKIAIDFPVLFSIFSCMQVVFSYWVLNLN